MRQIFPEPDFIETNGLRMAVYEQGEGPAVVFLHGFPELDYYAAAFAASGFTGPINWYRNWTHNWEQLEGVDPAIDIPTLFIGAMNDVVVPLQHIEGMKPLVSDLTMHMLDCGHWTQQERPDDVNRLIVDWLS